jgi:hypothetical protein
MIICKGIYIKLKPLIKELSHGSDVELDEGWIIDLQEQPARRVSGTRRRVLTHEAGKQAGWRSDQSIGKSWRRWSSSVSRLSVVWSWRRLGGGHNRTRDEATSESTRRTTTDGPGNWRLLRSRLCQFHLRMDEPGSLFLQPILKGTWNTGPPPGMGPRRLPMLAMGQRRPCMRASVSYTHLILVEINGLVTHEKGIVFWACSAAPVLSQDFIGGLKWDACDR